VITNVDATRFSLMLLPENAFKVVFVSSGGKVCRYDPIIDKHTKRQQICSRQNSILTNPEVLQGVFSKFKATSMSDPEKAQGFTGASLSAIVAMYTAWILTASAT
jgi:hypothetical protein